MQHTIFSVHDSAAGAFLPPFFLPNENMGRRIFGQCVNDETHQFSKAPQDYTLFMLGTFSDTKGEITTHPAPISCGNGVTYQAETPPAQISESDQLDNETRN